MFATVRIEVGTGRHAPIRVVAKLNKIFILSLSPTSHFTIVNFQSITQMQVRSLLNLG
jgi:hypothetical protein